MLDTIAENKPDRRPVILLCAYDESDSAWLRDDGDWSPPGTRLRAVGPGEPDLLSQQISGELRDADCRAVLLIGRTRKSDGFRLQMRAENRALNGGGKVSSIGPGLARATAPVAEMVRALHEAGLTAEATSEGEEDVGSYLLYRVLTALPEDADVPSIGLLRASASLNVDQARLGLQTAAAAMAQHLSPLPRARSA